MKQNIRQKAAPFYRRAIPVGARDAIWRAISRGIMLHKASTSVCLNLKNIAPVVIKKNVQLLSQAPTLCSVFTGRNDDYVPDNEARIRAVIEWNSRVLCNEVIFVEWNPPADRPLLSPYLARDYPNLRAYVVPPEIHAQVCSHPRMMVMEELGKNVGIRRARSEYICATNGYILWDQRVRRMARLLDKHLVFRTRRVEWRWDGYPVTQRCLKDNRNRIEFSRGWGQDLAYGCGDFTLAHRELWHRAGGYDESLKGTRINADGRGLLQLLSLGGRPVHMGLHYHIFHLSSSSRQTEFTKDSTYGEAFDYWGNLPYRNPATWGLSDCTEEPLAERVWKLVRS